MRPFPLALAALILTAAPLAAAPPDSPSADLPVRRVTLYTSGVGYFERSGVVDGDAAQTLLFPIGQVNDVLKSLVLLDTGGGSIRPVTYAAQDPLNRQLQSFSVDLSDNPDRATLLNRLRGTSVTVTAGTETVTGTIIGVETQTVTLPSGGGTTPQSTLNLAAEDGLHSIPLSTVSAVKINDPKVASELNQALAVVAQGRDAGKRAVRLDFAGRGRREVTVGYLTEAPLWQTTYRLVLGKSPVLQGWALVQNTSQDDWSDVSLTLVSGRPISFIQDLYTPQYVPRPTVQPRVAASPTPQTYDSDLNASTDVPAPAPAMPATAMAPMSGAGGFGGGGFIGEAANSTDRYVPFLGKNGVSQAAGGRLDFNGATRESMVTSGAQLGTALFTYQIKVPVSVPRQQSAMIPFVSGDIQAQPVAIFNPQVQAEHPLSGARLKNTTGLHLMGGPLTVFDEGAGGSGTGYVGDALIDDTEPGQTRLISYALDLAIDAHAEPGKGSGAVIAVKIAKGVLTITRREEASTIYTLKNNGAKAETVVIEHPNRGEKWTLLEPAKATEKTADVLRFDVPVSAKASEQFKVREEHPDYEADALLDTDQNTLLFYIRSGEASAAVKAALQEVVASRQAVAETNTKISDLTARLDAISQGQTRIRDNMKALDHTSALYKRYVGELDAQETHLEALQAQKDALETELAQRQASLNDYVAHLSVE